MELSLRIFILVWLIAPPVSAKVYLTQKQALKRVFLNPQKIERKALFLSPVQVKAIEELSRTKVESRLVAYYKGQSIRGGRSYAFFQTEIVRTMPATYMVVLDGRGKIESVEILAFYEPEDYLPRNSWIKLLQGKSSKDKLQARQDIPNITGASLSVRSITNTVRRICATHEIVLRGIEP